MLSPAESSNILGFIFCLFPIGQFFIAVLPQNICELNSRYNIILASQR